MTWEAQEPPSDFAERVTATAVREQRVATRRRLAVAVGGIALAAAAAIALVVVGRPTPAHGEATAGERRVEVALGTRGVAVLEPGAHIVWHGDTVEQDRGDVFYRVEPGATFSVHTPLASARVLGTCFRVSYETKESLMKRRDFGAGALGAVAATLVVIGVYEGKVAVSHGSEAVTVGAGESAVADAKGVRPARPGAPVAAAAATNPKDEAALRQRLAALEQEKATLEHELSAANDAVGKSPYDLSADDWAKLAEQGAFKYQLPCFREGGFRPSAEQLAHLGLAAKDADAIQAAYRSSNQRFVTTMRTICATPGQKPDDVDMGTCMQSLFQGLYGQGSEGARTTFTGIAEIRAGKRPEPPAAQLSPQQKMLMFFSGELKNFEGELAKTFGAEDAHRIAFADDLCFDANTLH